MKKLRKRIHRFTAVFEPDPGGGYVVYVPSLPGCATQGETFEEAKVNVKDAIEGYLAVKKQLREDVAFGSEETIVSRIPVAVSA